MGKSEVDKNQTQKWLWGRKQYGQDIAKTDAHPACAALGYKEAKAGRKAQAGSEQLRESGEGPQCPVPALGPASQLEALL